MIRLPALVALKARHTQELADVCRALKECASCSNMLMADAMYCRKCGKAATRLVTGMRVLHETRGYGLLQVVADADRDKPYKVQFDCHKQVQL